MSNAKNLLCAVLIAGFALTLGACGSKNSEITAASARRNPSPELQSIPHTREQRKNMHARTIDTNLRQIWDDLDRILLLDEPVKFSQYHIP